MDTTADDLELAADIIEFERGWCQGAIENDRGEVCLTGAFRLAAGYLYPTLSIKVVTPEQWHRFMTMGEVFEDFTGRYPVGFNDAPGQTKEEILDTLRRCAKARREVSPAVQALRFYQAAP